MLTFQIYNELQPLYSDLDNNEKCVGSYRQICDGFFSCLLPPLPVTSFPEDKRK